MDISLAIHELLIKLVKSTPGLQHVMLTDSTGLTIANLSRSSNQLELEGIGALTTALFLGMGYQGGEMKLGELGFVFSEFSSGKLVMQSIEKNYVLVGVISHTASVQKVKTCIKRYLEPILHQINLSKTSRKIEKKISTDLFSDAIAELD
ncbi:MAG: roadblock/LC7 domain-containing protein [Candidatus Hodarchaeales archaeon]|jgi:predicted regulator of Ras-like GTPase activity (Roadblock/LC7/MglB family)